MGESAVRAERLGATSVPPSYTWEVPGKPVVVDLSLDLVDRLESEVIESFRSLNSSGSEIGGLLLGKVQSGSPTRITIEQYEPIPCDYARGPLYRFADPDVQRFDRALQQHGPGAGLRVVGLFRSHTRKGLSLDAEDLGFFSGHFREPWQVMLLIRPYATKASTAGLFIWENGAVRGEASYREFRFRRGELECAAREAEAAVSEPSASAVVPEPPPKAQTRAQIVPIASRREITLPPPAAEPAPKRPEFAEPAGEKPPIESAAAAPPVAAVDHKPLVAPPVAAPPAAAPPVSPVFDDDPGPAATSAPSGHRKLAWIGGSTAVALLLLSGMLLYPGLLHKPHHVTPSAAQDTSALSLHVERSAGELLLSWNRDSESIKNAAHATLSIVDGEQHENVDMDLSQLRNGSIVYSPSSSDVVFQLSVTGRDASKIQSESVRVLRTRPSPMPENGPAPAVKQSAPEAPPAANPPSAGVPDPEAASPDQANRNLPLKPFHAELLAQRLRAPRPSDLPDAPGLGTPAPGAVAVPGMSFLPAAAPVVPAPPVPASAPAAPSPQAKMGGVVEQAQPVSRVSPEYPAAAKQSRVQGAVVVAATVGPDGRVKSAKAISGPPLLQGVAVAAVRAWIYRPALLNGTPVASETRVELNFTLDR